MIQGSRNKSMVAKKKLVMVVFLVVLVTIAVCEEARSCKLRTYGTSVISCHSHWPQTMDIDMKILKQLKKEQNPMQQKKITNTMIITFDPLGGHLM
jgi:hypothetical protein